MRYKSGYKYQLTQDYSIALPRIRGMISTPFISLGHAGELLIKRGYAWDGPSGPTIDTKNFMRGSLVHDALYQLMRQGELISDYREAADDELKRICLEDGMSRLRAWYVHRAVRLAAGHSADPASKKIVWEAP